MIGLWCAVVGSLGWVYTHDLTGATSRMQAVTEEGVFEAAPAVGIEAAAGTTATGAAGVGSGVATALAFTTGGAVAVGTGVWLGLGPANRDMVRAWSSCSMRILSGRRRRLLASMIRRSSSFSP